MRTFCPDDRAGSRPQLAAKPFSPPRPRLCSVVRRQSLSQLPFDPAEQPVKQAAFARRTALHKVHLPKGQRGFFVPSRE